MLLFWQVIVKKAPTKGAFFFALLFTARLPVCVAMDGECRTTSYDEVATVEKVYDGDTIRLTDGRKIRFIAINTPEMAHNERPEQAFARDALERVRVLLGSSRVVQLKYGRDKTDHYGRKLAHVFNDNGVNVSADLLGLGLGFAIAVPPNNWNMECYFAREKQARQAGTGVWNHPDFSARNPQLLDPKQTGFMIVKGEITGIGYSRKNIWLDMGDNFSIKLPRKYLDNFKAINLSQLEGQRIRVRGWVAFYNGKLRMSLRHPAMFEILTENK